jgi:hypothetical protein
MRLNCARCGFTISPRSAWLTVEHCPRCVARDRVAIRLRNPDRAPGAHHAHGLGSRDTHTEGAEQVVRPVSAAGAPETIIARWIGAFNMRDLPGMLACLDRDVDFHPLKLRGVASGGYRGQEGVERWFAELTARGLEHRIVVAEIRVLPSGAILTVGGLSFADEPAGTPVCAVHQIDDGLIVTAHHYMSDPDTLLRLGFLE